MAIADFDTYIALRNAAKPVTFTRSSAGDTAASNSYQSSWLGVPFAGTAPTTAVACSDATTGAIPLANFGALTSVANVRRIATLGAKQINLVSAANATILVCDRLSHQGGLSGTVTTSQTTNLPTATLTRYTSGVGVFLAVEIYTTVGTTATTLTATYTNSSGTGSRVTQPVVFGGTGRRLQGTTIILPLQDGDIGVDSVESVTVLATTGTAGNFGVTLFKPVDVCPTTVSVAPDGKGDYDAFVGGGGLCPVLLNNACPWLLVATSTSSGTFDITTKFIEEP